MHPEEQTNQNLISVLHKLCNELHELNEHLTAKKPLPLSDLDVRRHEAIQRICEDKKERPAAYMYIEELHAQHRLTTKMTNVLLRPRIFLGRDMEILTKGSWRHIRGCGKSTLRDIEQFMAKNHMHLSLCNRIEQISYQKGDYVITVVPIDPYKSGEEWAPLSQGYNAHSAEYPKSIPEYTTLRIRSVSDAVTENAYVMPIYEAEYENPDGKMVRIRVSHGEIERF